jgi:hypothetical protein
MKTTLSHILPVWHACQILGEDVVTKIVLSLLNYRKHVNAQNQAAQNADLSAEVALLTKSLFYHYNAEHDAAVPADIAQCWKRWLNLRYLALDKPTLLNFFVPSAVQPHSGPAGHMGLFDCWMYSLQTHGPTNNVLPFILIPDVLIALAISKNYARARDLQHVNKLLKTNNNDGSFGIEALEISEQDKQARQDQDVIAEEPDKAIWTMALFSFRIYDSYQKKGVVARDTIHRFLTDVYGEDSFKQPEARTLLEYVYEDNLHERGWLHRTVNEAKFCQRTTDMVKPNKSCILMDWIATLICNMLPPEQVAGSVQVYLESVNSRPVPLCDVYGLAEHRLYEIKRRFHSLVQSSSLVMQGDPIESVDEDMTTQPKQAITQSSFCAAVSKANDDMGHGGYLPKSIAALVFRQGCYETAGVTLLDEMKFQWSLYHVLLFGCTAVRVNITTAEDEEEDSDLPLLRFIFHMFQISGTTTDIDELDRSVLTRGQVAKMLLLLNDYVEFRGKADTPPGLEENPYNEEVDKSSVELDADIEESMVDKDAADAIGVLPPDDDDGADKTKLKYLIDYVFRGASIPDQMNFDEFCAWKASKGNSSSILSHLMMELRLVASVMFGVPPTKASLEVAIVGELEARQKERYPQTEVSRRGPRGTIWYLIDSGWLRNWTAIVRKNSKSLDNDIDMRGDVTSDRVRGHGRINNRPLLAEGGSLALRQDIRWKHDYDILAPLAYTALQAWYDGGPPIYRTVVKYLNSAISPHQISKNRMPTENELELYPCFVTVFLCDSASKGEARPFQQNYQVSRVSPVRLMHLQMCRELEVDPEMARLWLLETFPEVQAISSTPNEKSSTSWILDLDQNLIEQRKRWGSTADSSALMFLLEMKDKETGLWPRGIDGKLWTLKENFSEGVDPEQGDGVVGLYNMG